LTPFGPEHAAKERTKARELLGLLAEAIRSESGVSLRIDIAVRTGDPTETIRAVAAENGAHLVVVGSHGRQGVKRAVLGSVAESVLRTAECPVLVVPNDLDVEIPGSDETMARELA
jgi:nucleotide-binding universal stress UspA family protein